MKPVAATLEAIPPPDAEAARLLEQVRRVDPQSHYVGIDKRGRVVELSEQRHPMRGPYGVYVSQATDILRYTEATRAED